MSAGTTGSPPRACRTSQKGSCPWSPHIRPPHPASFDGLTASSSNQAGSAGARIHAVTQSRSHAVSQDTTHPFCLRTPTHTHPYPPSKPSSLASLPSSSSSSSRIQAAWYSEVPAGSRRLRIRLLAAAAAADSSSSVGQVCSPVGGGSRRSKQASSSGDSSEQQRQKEGAEAQ